MPSLKLFTDLLGKTEAEAVKVDVIVCCIDDVKSCLMEVFRAKEGDKVRIFFQIRSSDHVMLKCVHTREPALR